MNHLIELADQLVCLASWEPRFLEGVKNDLKVSKARECYLFFLNEFEDKTRDNINSVETHCADIGVSVHKIELSYKSPLKTRQIILSNLQNIAPNSTTLVDFTTMTREIMWIVLDLLSSSENDTRYVYWQPDETGRWTSKNSTKPRLVIGRAGISEYGKPTLIAVTTGFDPSRLDQMVGYFEPEKVILFVQDGEQFENRENNIQQYDDYRLGGTRPKICLIDSYSEDHGLEIITNELAPYLETHNIVIASFGPKPSAVALHYYQEMHPEASLAYTPALDFNKDYSVGIGDAMWGRL